MRKAIFFTLFFFLTAAAGSAQTAIDFTLTDCSGTSVNLFSTLNQGKVVVLVYEHQCGSCTNGALNIKTVINTYYSGNNAIQLMYLDNGGYNCAMIANWITNNNLVPGLTFEYSSSLTSPYGSGMPVIIVAAGSNHKIYLQANDISDTASVHSAIKNALADLSSAVELLPSVKTNFKIYPNPVVTGKMSIYFNKNITSPVTADIVDITGTIVKHSIILESFTNDKTREVSVSDLKDGMYFIRVYSSDGIIVKKFSTGK